jgi:glycosyltransferase involved in cell wall biosynthesis
MPKRILIVNEFFSFGDGSSLYIAKISEALMAKGYQVNALYGTKREKEFNYPEIETYFVPDILGFNYVNSSKKLEAIKQIVLSSKPDIIFIHQVLNPHVIARIAKLAPAIRYEHGFRLSCPTGRRDAKAVDQICRHPFGYTCMLRAYTQKCMPRNPILAVKRIVDVKHNILAHKNLSKVIVASRYIKDILVRSGLKKDLIEILPYFVEIPKNLPIRKTTAKACILFVGRMEYEKGPAFLMSALSKIETSAKVVFAGKGPELGKLKKLARMLPNHDIEFLGWVDNDRLGHYYSMADLLVVPSVWPEPFGIIGIEAMAYSIPVVAFDVGGISEWLEDGKTGFLVERKNIAQLADRIELLLADKPLAKRLGQQGRVSMMKKFTPDLHIDKLIKIFEETKQDFRI